MKSLCIGIGVYVLGFFLVGICSNIFDSGEFSYFYAITFSILYLSAVVAISTSLILKELKKNTISNPQSFSSEK